MVINSRVKMVTMSPARFIESDLDEGLGVEGKRSRGAKDDNDKITVSPSAPKRRPAPDGRDQDAKVKKRKSFDRFTITVEDDTDIFR
ncbi:MAG: hypothetical protein WC346_07675 [Methanogenium sp.]